MESYVCGCRVNTADRCEKPTHGDRFGSGKKEGAVGLRAPPIPRAREGGWINPDGYAVPTTFSGWGYLRDPVRRFALAMETKLRRHDKERGENGWEGDDLLRLTRRLREETDELVQACRAEPISMQALVSEAADVANFAMMIADAAGALARTPLPGLPTEDTPSAAGDRTWMVGPAGYQAIYHGISGRWHVQVDTGAIRSWVWSEAPPSWAPIRVETVGPLGEEAILLADRQVLALEEHLRDVSFELELLKGALHDNLAPIPEIRAPKGEDVGSWMTALVRAGRLLEERASQKTRVETDLRAAEETLRKLRSALASPSCRTIEGLSAWDQSLLMAYRRASVAAAQLDPAERPAKRPPMFTIGSLEESEAPAEGPKTPAPPGADAGTPFLGSSPKPMFTVGPLEAAPAEGPKAPAPGADAGTPFIGPFPKPAKPPLSRRARLLRRLFPKWMAPLE